MESITEWYWDVEPNWAKPVMLQTEFSYLAERELRGSRQQSLKQLQARLQELQGREGCGVGFEIKTLQQQIEALVDKEDLQWRQRAKLDCLGTVIGIRNFTMLVPILVDVRTRFLVYLTSKGIHVC